METIIIKFASLLSHIHSSFLNYVHHKGNKITDKLSNFGLNIGDTSLYLTWDHNIPTPTSINMSSPHPTVPLHHHKCKCVNLFGKLHSSIIFMQLDQNSTPLFLLEDKLHSSIIFVQLDHNSTPLFLLEDKSICIFYSLSCNPNVLVKRGL